MDIFAFVANVPLVYLICFAYITAALDFDTVTVAGIRNKIISNRMTCAEIISEFAERIKFFEKATLKLGAVITINPFAGNEASELDNHYRRTNSLVGTLHCAPLVVGDNIDAAHLPTTAGVKALSNSVASSDSDVVQLLRNQGAVVVAKGNISPFAWEHRFVISETGGVAKNAFGAAYTTYGANGGTAQAIGSVYGLIGVATDTGGSLSLPASAASVLALRPPWNMVSTRGVIPVNDFMDTVGPMARRAEDLALVMDILDSGKRDRMSYQRRTQEDGSSLKGLRIGVLVEQVYDRMVLPSRSVYNGRGVFETFELSTEMRALILSAISNLRSLDAEISNVSLGATHVLPYMSPFNEFDVSACSGEWMNSYLNRLSPEASYRNLHQLIRSRSLAGTFQTFFEAAERKAPLKQCDSARETFNRARASLNTNVMEPLFFRGLDVILAPLMADFPPRTYDRREQPIFAAGLVAMSGYPSLALPIGFSSSRISSAYGSSSSNSASGAPRGLPGSVLLISRANRMDELVRIAYAYQNRYGVTTLPEAVSVASSVVDFDLTLGAVCVFVFLCSWR